MQGDTSQQQHIYTVVDPRQKYKYFFHHWNKKYHPGVKRKTEAMYKEFRVDDAGALSSTVDSHQSNKKGKVDDDFDIVEHRFGKEEDVQTEVEQYLNSSKLTLSTQEANWTFDI